MPSLAGRAAGVCALAALAVASGLPAGSSELAPRVVAAAGVTAHSNSRANEAIVVAQNLRPGDAVSGTVTISNEGSDGRLFLQAQPPVDRVGPGAAPLSERLEVSITDDSRGVALPATPIAASGCLSLGEIAAGERRVYRFTIRFRPSESSRDDNAFAGSSTEVGYRWTQRDGCSTVATETELHGAPTGGLRVELPDGVYVVRGRQRFVRVPIRCAADPAQSCVGWLRITNRSAQGARSVAAESARFRLRGGSTRRVRVRLRRGPWNRLRRTGLLRIRVDATVRDESGRAVVTTRRALVRAPRR